MRQLDGGKEHLFPQAQSSSLPSHSLAHPHPAAQSRLLAPAWNSTRSSTQAPCPIQFG